MSIRLVAQVHLTDRASPTDAEALADALRGCAVRIDEISHSHAATNRPGSLGGGHLTWDVAFENDAACAALFERSAPVDGVGLVGALGDCLDGLDETVRHTDAVVVEPMGQLVSMPDLVGVKRTLLLTVRGGTPSASCEHFERDMLAMPDHVPAIRNWSFGRVRTSSPRPMESRWTHVWEQEFESEAGLLVDYMTSPYHWGLIDAWFDLECPHSIVETHLAHVFCQAAAPVLRWGVEASALRAG